MGSSGVYKITSITDVHGKPREDAAHQALIGAHTRLYGSPRCGYGLMIATPDGQLARTTTIHTVINKYGDKYIVKTINSNYYLEPDESEDEDDGHRY